MVVVMFTWPSQIDRYCITFGIRCNVDRFGRVTRTRDSVPIAVFWKRGEKGKRKGRPRVLSPYNSRIAVRKMAAWSLSGTLCVYTSWMALCTARPGSHTHSKTVNNLFSRYREPRNSIELARLQFIEPRATVVAVNLSRGTCTLLRRFNYAINGRSVERERETAFSFRLGH